MLKSISLGFSLFLFLVLILLLKFVDERTKKLFTEDELIVEHIKNYVLLKKKKIRKPMLLSHYISAINSLEDESLQKEYKTELNTALSNLNEGQNYITFKNCTLVFDFQPKKGDYY